MNSLLNEWSSQLKKNEKPRFYIIFCFYAVFFLCYFSPALLQGRYLGPGDGVVQYVPLYYSSIELWTSKLFTGLSLVSDPASWTWYLPALVSRLLGVSYNIFMISAYVGAAFFTYLLVFELTNNRYSSLISGLVFSLSGFFMGHLGHANIIHSAMWLPIMVLAFEKLNKKDNFKWVVIGAFSVSMSFLAGHAQIFVNSLLFCGIYVLYHTLVMKKTWKYILISAVTVLIGLLLSALQLLPFIVAMGKIERSTISFQEFLTYTLPIKETITLVFPYILGGAQSYYDIPYFGSWGLTETIGYVGILPLFFFISVFVFNFRNRRVLFWCGITIFILLLSIGGNNPLMNIIYKIPILNSVRAQSRHFLEFSLAMSVLTGYGLTYLKIADTKKIKRVLGLFVFSMVVLISVVSINYERLNNLFNKKYSHTLPSLLNNKSVVIPIVLIAAICLLIYLMINRFRYERFINSMLVIIVVADLSSFGYFYEWRTSSPHKEVFQINEKSKEIYSIIGDDRYIPINGVASGLELFPPNLSRYWGLHNVGGYSQLIEKRFSHLTSIASSGIVEDKRWIDPDNSVFDILGTKYAVLPVDLISPKVEFEQGGIGWSNMNLDIGLSNQNDTSIFIPNLNDLYTSISIVSNLSNSIPVSTGQTISRISVYDDNNKEYTFDVKAGLHTSEWAWDREDVKATIQHERAPVFQSFASSDSQGNDFEGHSYLTTFGLPKEMKISKVKIHWLGPNDVQLNLIKLSLSNGQLSNPLGAYNSFLDQEKWVQLKNSNDLLVLKNNKAMPRAWVVTQTKNMEPDSIVDIIKSSRFSDGQPYVPSYTALTEEFKDVEYSNGNDYSVRVKKETGNSLSLEVYSEHPAFLVLSDQYDEGWEASVNGNREKIVRTNYVQRGLEIPAGTSNIQFNYNPVTYQIGKWITTITIFGLIVYYLFFVRKTRREK